MEKEDRKTQKLKLTQITQNKMPRVLGKSRIRDKQSIKRIAAKIKLRGLDGSK
jgi:tRNA U34 2-thiouridine synthase MnmA/TrmU